MFTLNDRIRLIAPLNFIIKKYLTHIKYYPKQVDYILIFLIYYFIILMSYFKFLHFF